MTPPERDDELGELARRHTWPTLAPLSVLDDPEHLHIVVGGDGCWVQDRDGRRWFDAIAGNCLMNVGYGRAEIAVAAAEQMRQLTYAPQFTMSEPAIRLAGEIAARAPDPQSRVFLVSGGSEAVETALKMARKYHHNRNAAGRHKVISRRGSYHGATLACASLGGHETAAADFGPLVPGNIAVTQPCHYDCVHCMREPACTLECARDVERAIVEAGADTVSAVIAEPISTSRLEIPDPGYFPLLREICDRHGALLILDEVITGWGRTGRWFGCEHWGVVPDLITIGKGLTAGYAPIGAVVVRKSIADAFDGADDRAFRHALTFGGHPVSARVALSVLGILEREGVLENATEQGRRLVDLLRTRLADVSIVGDIRGGLGLMCAVELVRDRETRMRFAPEMRLGERMTRAARANGLLMRQSGHVLYLIPPLTITAAEVDDVVDRVVAVVETLQTELYAGV